LDGRSENSVGSDQVPRQLSHRRLLQPYQGWSLLPHAKSTEDITQDGQLDVWDYYYRQNEVAFSHKVSDAPLTCIKISYQGSGNQILGGKLVAIGDQDGTVTLLELCESLYTLQKNERDIMGEIFNREMIKEKNL
jgi:dynein intermediate chain 2